MCAMKPSSILAGRQLTSVALSIALPFVISSAVIITSAEAHNGAIAYATPMPAVTIDGDFSDWPEDMTHHAMEKIRVGVDPEDSQDLSAHFRIGFSPALQKIFIAVEVVDQSLVLDTTQYVNWNTHDGMELYLDATHHGSKATITQFSHYGLKRLIFGHEENWDDVEMEMMRTSSGRSYEWAIAIDRPLSEGLSLGLDLVVLDKDEDGSYSWLAWGERSQKLSSPNNCGDLVLVQSNPSLCELQGHVDLSALLSGPTDLPVRFESTDSRDLWLQTRSDSLGNFAIRIPTGNYRVYVPAEMMRSGIHFYRMKDNPAITIEASEDMRIAERLVAEQEAPPSLAGEKGLLFDFSAEQHSQVDQFIEIYRTYYDIPGVSLALIKDRQVVYHQTYGVTSMKTNEPVNHQTLFEAASITKPVFGYLVLRLAEKGTIDLDKPLYEYLPFEALEETPAYKKMTARHVLIHRSGLPNWGVPLINTPGTKYGYSGEGFEYLKRVVCEITGQDIEQLLQTEVMEPLGLYHMQFKDSEALREVAAIGHQGTYPTYWPIPTEPGMAHSMHTEAKAFATFAIALLDKKGLTPSTYQEMTQIHTKSPEKWWNHSDYPEGAGLGVHVRESSQGKVFGHGGNNGDFKCQFEVYDDLDMGFVVFTNSSLGDQLCQDMAAFLVEGAHK